MVVVPKAPAECAGDMHELVDYRFDLVARRLPVKFFGNKLNYIVALALPHSKHHDLSDAVDPCNCPSCLGAGAAHNREPFGNDPFVAKVLRYLP